MVVSRVPRNQTEKWRENRGEEKQKKEGGVGREKEKGGNEEGRKEKLCR